MERLKVKKKSLKDFTYTDKEIADEIYAAMNSTQFLGVSVNRMKLIHLIPFRGEYVWLNELWL